MVMQARGDFPGPEKRGLGLQHLAQHHGLEPMCEELGPESSVVDSSWGGD